MKGRNMTRWRDPAKDPRQEPKSNLITRPGFERMQGLYEHLRSERRPELSRKVAEAAAQGDRSENADYTYNKRELNKTIARIRYLGKRLDELTVVERKPDDRERVFFAAYVCLEDDHGEELRLRLVGPDETDGKRGWISIDAPLARALLGKRLDDEIEVETPGGLRRYVIIEIDYH
ncbi:transcription elongation factor GreB [Halotalea alkalilenta]|uniref:transcription elongation factor GreB n=1 Tax=Halotalea alkalilenta TaxID=376489 RepID=UPI0009DD80A3|nr:transcription elongation factor GreB [Halotalea alkalilenta]